MKTKNFPGKRNQRRISVLDKLQKELPTLDGDKNKKKRKRVEKEISNLQSKVMEPGIARAIRTKSHKY